MPLGPPDSVRPCSRGAASVAAEGQPLSHMLSVMMTWFYLGAQVIFSVCIPADHFVQLLAHVGTALKPLGLLHFVFLINTVAELTTEIITDLHAPKFSGLFGFIFT